MYTSGRFLGAAWRPAATTLLVGLTNSPPGPVFRAVAVAAPLGRVPDDVEMLARARLLPPTATHP